MSLRPPQRSMPLALAALAFVAGLVEPPARAQSNYATPYFFTTLAGSGLPGSADGVGAAASFRNPSSLAVDAAGNVFVTDEGNHTIRKITPSGVVSTIAGQAGSIGSTDATGTSARFNMPGGIGVDSNGNIFVADTFNNTIRKITSAGVVTTFAGQAGSAGSIDGTGTAARLNRPDRVAIDSSGLFVMGNATIRKITSTAVVTTLAGSPSSFGSTDGTGSAARFNIPLGGTVAPNGDFFVAEWQNKLIRKVTPGGVVTIFAGQPGSIGSVDATGIAARFNFPSSVARDNSGNFFVTDTQNHTIRKITPVGAVTTVAGLAGSSGNTDGTGDQARFNSPFAVAVDSRGNLYIADRFNHTIRRSVFPPADVTVTFNPFVNIGSSTQLVVTSTSDYPTTFQWHKEGVAIAGATTNTLSLSNVQATDTAAYTITVANIAGATTSLPLQVYVLVPVVITTNPVSQTVSVGLPVQFNVSATPATGLSYQWRKNGAAIPGATNALFSIGSATLADAGGYSVGVRNSNSITVSTTAMLTVNVPVNTEPVTHTVTVGAFVQLGFNGTIPAGTSFQWRKDGTPIVGATNALFIINAATLGDAGSYTVVTTSGTASQLSNTAALIVVPLTAPVITTQPANQTIVIGTSAEFSVAATSSAAMSFQWRKNGIAVTGATGERLTIPSATLLDAGTYSVAVTNTGGSTMSNNATLVVNAPSAPPPTPVGISPSFNIQPVDQTISAGTTLSLSVTVAGTQPLTFQWLKNGTAIPGATASLFSVPNVQLADAASYSIVVTNSGGVATSTPAIVRVVVPPLIQTQPASRSAIEGSSAEFTVTASGTSPFTYQWRKDGGPIVGATSAALVLNAIQLAAAGSYSVTITNSAGAVTSAAASLVVTAAGPSSRFSNVSVRTSLTADQTVIVGLTSEGGSRDVLVRAIGPALTGFGLSTAMMDPRLDLFRGQTLILANDDWPAALTPTFASAGAFGLASGSRDAAFRQSLNGAFSIHARGNGPGVVLVEVYDLGEGNTPRLVNVSARNRVGTGDDILIAGFTISGTGTKQVLIRAVGPGLAALGLPGTLVDPKLELFSSANILIAENDNWAANLVPTFTAVGAFALPSGSRDAALYTTLPTGSYTVQVRGADGGTGEAIIEVYEVP